MATNNLTTTRNLYVTIYRSMRIICGDYRPDELTFERHAKSLELIRKAYPAVYQSAINSYALAHGWE